MPALGTKSRVKNTIKIVDLYKAYVEYTDPALVVDKATFKAILNDYYAEVGELLLAGQEFQLPTALGNIRIIKYKHDGNTITTDWINSKKYGKLIENLNLHTNQFKYKFLWTKATANTALLKGYRFMANRSLKRKLAKCIKEFKYDYFEI